MFITKKALLELPPPVEPVQQKNAYLAEELLGMKLVTGRGVYKQIIGRKGEGVIYVVR